MPAPCCAVGGWLARSPDRNRLARDEAVRAAARAARGRGLWSLPIPANYYDDLVARFELSSAYVEELKSLGLLYDRDERGEFLQFYTETVGAVFFEVVQRVGGYEGYGAANAPVRLAAQHLHDARHRVER